MGEFILPTLSVGSGNASFTCRVTAHVALLDLGGAIATEDDRDDTYTTVGGDVLRFTRGNLERICDDALRFFPAPARATVDSNPVSGTQVSTPVFEVKVNPTAPAPFWQDSVDLGHPGTVAAAYCGWKAEVPLDVGRHVIEVNLSDVAGAPRISATTSRSLASRGEADGQPAVRERSIAHSPTAPDKREGRLRLWNFAAMLGRRRRARGAVCSSRCLDKPPSVAPGS